ncbi:MAG: FtsW/RodA/SpoVE family cell cycle protein, partial [Clostridia bacterium]|nr:FtsW/RodA/SpoVE family cell cycle protein [Clostridia bacterium]
MNKKAEIFLSAVCAEIRCKSVHPEIKKELLQHIDELTEAYIADGYSQEDAITKAVTAMGDAKEVGKQLHRQHKPQMGWSILILTVCVSLFGILLMLIPQHPGRFAGSMEKQLTFMAIGAAVIIGTYFFDYTKLKKCPLLFYGAGILLVGVCLIFGNGIAGVTRQLSIGGISLYVPGIAFVLYIISFCGFVEKLQHKVIFGMFLLMWLGLFSISSVLILPSLCDAAFLTIAYIAVFLRSVYRNYFSKHGKLLFFCLTVFFLLIGMMAVAILVLSEPYRLDRVLSFLDKGVSDPMGGGWIYMISYKILQASQWIGKAAPIPEGDIGWIMPDTMRDFALLNLIGNYGWVVGIAVILIVSVLIIRMFTLSSRVKTSFGRNLSLGCCILLGIQFVCNILMNLGYCPIMNVTLPFISFGGSLYIINAFLVGLILSVWRRNRILLADPIPNLEYKTYRQRITFENHKLIIDFGVDK